MDFMNFVYDMLRVETIFIKTVLDNYLLDSGSSMCSNYYSFFAGSPYCSISSTMLVLLQIALYYV